MSLKESKKRASKKFARMTKKELLTELAATNKEFEQLHIELEDANVEIEKAQHDLAVQKLKAENTNVTRRVNSLNHTLQSQAHMIDDLLAEDQYTISEIASMIESTNNRVRSHINHLVHKCRCTIVTRRSSESREKIYSMTV